MPKKTFINLSEAKKNRFREAFLQEFSIHTYEEASISSVVKDLKIAKGSVYQYFDDKLDLFLYLKTYAETVKMGYIKNSNRSDFTTFWEYYRSLYKQGVNFDLNHRLESKFLYMLGKNTSSATIGKYLKGWKEKAIAYFSEVIKSELENGYFRNDLPIHTMAHFLVSSNLMVGEIMESKFDLTFDLNIQNGDPVFALQAKELLKVVDENIKLLQSALNAPKKQGL